MILGFLIVELTSSQRILRENRPLRHEWKYQMLQPYPLRQHAIKSLDRSYRLLSLRRLRYSHLSSLKSEVWSLKSEVWSLKSEVWSPKSEVRSLKSEVWSPFSAFVVNSSVKNLKLRKTFQVNLPILLSWIMASFISSCDLKYIFFLF